MKGIVPNFLMLANSKKMSAADIKKKIYENEGLIKYLVKQNQMLESELERRSKEE